MEKKCKKAKWVPGEALQIAVKRREAKSKGEKERYKHLNLHGDRMLVPTAGMAEKEALDSTAGCISVIQESFELGAWNAAADGGLRLLGQVSAKGASVHPVKKACFQC